MDRKDIKKIDIHVHASMWENAQINWAYPLATPAELRAKYDELNIEKGILLPLISPEHRFNIQTSEESEYLANKYPDTFYWFCNVDPRMGTNSSTTDFTPFLEHYKKRGAKGVGEITANLYIDDPLLDNLFYHCAQCDMPIIIHIAPKKYDNYGIIDEMGLPRLEKLLKKYPDLKVIGHSQCFWSHITEDVNEEDWFWYPQGKVKPGRIVELMREYPNLYGDLSAGSGFNAVSRDPDFGYKFLEEFSDRLMFATDICNPENVIKLGPWIDEAADTGCLSFENYKKIVRDNAISILKLD